MARITRRRFVEQTALATAAVYGRPMQVLGRGRGIFGAREQNAVPLDATAVQKLASEITGRLITSGESDYDSARLVNNRAYDRHPALIVYCASASDVARTLEFGQRQSLPL